MPFDLGRGPGEPPGAGAVCGLFGGVHADRQGQSKRFGPVGKLDYDTSGFRSKAWDEFSKAQNLQAPDLDFVFTVCDNAAGEVCPIWPGQPMSAHWGVPDPADAEGSEAQVALAFADTYRRLQNRIDAFVNLPIATLDRLTLQAKLTEIGKTKDEA